MPAPFLIRAVAIGVSLWPLTGCSTTEPSSDVAWVEVVAVAASNARIRYTGRRWETGESVRLTFPGTEIRVRFKGAALVVRGEVTSGEAWFNRRVDGDARPRLDLPGGPFEAVVASGLDPASAHEVRLVRRNEAWQGTLRFDAFVLPEGGEILEPPPVRVRRIMALGDSITCGQNAEFIPPFAPEGNATANAELTYAWELARRFGADVHLVSYGGRGVVRDWQGNTDTGRAIELFERADSDNAEPAWDHARYVPDLITVCFGTNDFAKDLSQAVFQDAYRTLIARIHEVHPEAKLLLLSSPMLPGYAPARAAQLVAALREVEAAICAAGDDYVRVYPFGDYSGTDWDAHPIAPQHRAMADELEPIVREWLDWDVVEE